MFLQKVSLNYFSNKKTSGLVTIEDKLYMIDVTNSTETNFEREQIIVEVYKNSSKNSSEIKLDNLNFTSFEQEG